MLDKLKKASEIIKNAILYIFTPIVAIVTGIWFYMSRRNDERAIIEIEEYKRKVQDEKLKKAYKDSYDAELKWNDYAERVRESAKKGDTENGD